jgi:hypothetical protein
MDRAWQWPEDGPGHEPMQAALHRMVEAAGAEVLRRLYPTAQRVVAP